MLRMHALLRFAATLAGVEAGADAAHRWLPRGCGWLRYARRPGASPIDIMRWARADMRAAH